MIQLGDIRSLLGERQGPCVSIFLPATRHADRLGQVPIRLKNLVQEARKSLLATGLGAARANRLLQPAEKLLGAASSSQRRSDGYAIYLCERDFRHFREPFRFPEKVVVSQHFSINPLLPFIHREERFYVLALSQNEVRLLEESSEGMRRVGLEGLPRSLADALGHEEPLRQLQFHTRSPQGRGGLAAAVFHGQGVGTDDAKDRILRYFRMIDAGIQDLPAQERVPLVLAGVEYLFPIYRKANSYPFLMDEGILWR